MSLNLSIFLDNEDGKKDRQRRANFETTMEYAGEEKLCGNKARRIR